MGAVAVEPFSTANSLLTGKNTGIMARRAGARGYESPYYLQSKGATPKISGEETGNLVCLNRDSRAEQGRPDANQK